MNNHSISAYQTYILIFTSIIGVGILSFPRTMYHITGADMIWIILIPFALSWGIFYLMTVLCLRFPKQTIVEFSERILGSKNSQWLGKGLKIPFLISVAVTWFLTTAYVLRGVGEVTVTNLLNRTPIEIIMITFIVTAMVGASMPMEVIAKLNELLFPILLIPLFFMVVSYMQKGDLRNLLPFFQADWQQVWMAMRDTIYYFAGYSLIFIIMFFNQQSEKAVKIHFWSLLSAVAYYLVVFICTMGVFGQYELQKMIWPTLETVRIIDSPIQLFQRMESGMLAIWMIASFITLVNIFSVLVEFIRRSFQTSEGNRKWIALSCVPIIFYLAYFPSNVKEWQDYSQVTGTVILSIDVLVPLLLLVIAIIRRKRGGEKKDETISSTQS